MNPNLLSSEIMTMSGSDVDEFYIGWQTKAPPGIGARVRKAVVSLAFVAVAAAVVLAAAQRTIGVAVFEWGTLKTFKGILKSDPYPHLLVQRPGRGGGQSAYYLVAPFKFGLKSDAIAGLDGQAVTLTGTLLYRGNETMIEARPESIKPASATAPPNAQPGPVDLGRQTLVGEIVDSKCYLGVMNPGRLTPHRACAVRCISGGIPPILLVRQKEAKPLYFLLVSSDGRPVNKQVLDMVAEPIEITGEVIRQGELSILRADPATYRRIGE
jgi:hypothetical protein